MLLLGLGILNSRQIRSAVYEAENSAFFKAFSEAKNSGFSGEGYVNFDNVAGSYFETKIGMADAGLEQIKIRFANGTAVPRIVKIELNGELIADSVSFSPTGDWTKWDTLSISANLKKGVSYLRFISVSSDGGPNIDWLDVSGEQAKTFRITVMIEGPGQVIHPPKNNLLFSGEEITLVASPDYNSSFQKWTGDFTSDNDTLRFILAKNMSLTANFQEIRIEIPTPDFSISGYASVPGSGLQTTIGGTGGKITIIENLAQLINWGASREDNSSAETILIRGKIEATETTVISIKRGGNISILGDSDFGEGFAELKNISLNIRQYSNVIIRNLKMHEVFYPEDDLTIDECHHVWIDHCEFFSKIGPGIGVDTYDGLLDIKKGSHNVTVSWCWFHDHMKTVLIGHSDNNGEQDVNLEVTFRNNRFSNTDGRNPSLRFGKVHFYNNYLENITDYGFAVRNGAHAKLENNHFHSVNVPVATDKFEGHGFACLSGNIYSGSCSETSNQVSEPLDCGFWTGKIPYSYTNDPANTVKLSVEKYAGVGKIKTVTAIQEAAIQNKIRINNLYFEKPDGKLKLTLFNPTHQKLKVCVYSADGKNIGSDSRFFISGNQQLQMHLNSIRQGIYIVTVESQAERISRKTVF